LCYSSDRPATAALAGGITERIGLAIGGYDLVAFSVSRCRAARISADKRRTVFLFYDSHRLEIFAADPERIADAAKRKWPTVLAVNPGRQ
jgi:hypothetical protein